MRTKERKEDWAHIQRGRVVNCCNLISSKRDFEGDLHFTCMLFYIQGECCNSWEHLVTGNIKIITLDSQFSCPRRKLLPVPIPKQLLYDFRLEVFYFNYMFSSL